MKEKGFSLEDLDKLADALIQKDQRIAELEEENKKLNSCNEELHKNYAKCIDYWKQENAKLQEQLKNAIVPKFKYGQIVYSIDKQFNCIFDAVYIGENKDRIILSSRIFVSKYREIEKNLVFATEAEAQKYLEKNYD